VVLPIDLKAFMSLTNTRNAMAFARPTRVHKTPPHSSDCAQGNEAEYGKSVHMRSAGITPLTKRLSVSDSSQLHGD
jgi:hypothetical protein